MDCKCKDWKENIDVEYIDRFRSRLKVPGGWIYEVTQSNERGEIAIASCFVPDHSNKWELKENPTPLSGGGQ